MTINNQAGLIISDNNPSSQCHSESFGGCHSERSEESPLSQDKLREESVFTLLVDLLFRGDSSLRPVLRDSVQNDRWGVFVRVYYAG